MKPMNDSPPAWTFESSVTRSDGIRVQVTITVPRNAAWPDVPEVAEITQMTASNALNHIAKSQERPPF